MSSVNIACLFSNYSLSCTCVLERERDLVCVCVCVRGMLYPGHPSSGVYECMVYFYMHVYAHVCMRVFVCACVFVKFTFTLLWLLQWHVHELLNQSTL